MKCRFQPLSIRHKLLHEYSGSRIDPLRFSEEDLPAKTLIKIIKTQLGETKAEIEEDGLKPFSLINPAPEVTHLSSNLFLYLQSLLL